MTASYGDYPFFPYRMVNQLDVCETDKIEYWENLALQAVEFFSSKEDFMDWVYRNFFLEENRFTADVSWDLVTYIGENGLADA